MGRDKAMLLVDGRPLVRRTADVLVAAGVHPVFAVGGEAEVVRSAGVEWSADRFPGAGPLGGLLTAFEAVGSGRWLMVVACDLPRLGVDTVGRLLAGVRSVGPDGAPVADVVVATAPDPEPLVAVWWVDTCRPIVESAHARGERAVHRVLAQLRVHTVAVDPVEVLNANRPSDLPPGAGRPDGAPPEPGADGQARHGDL